MQAADRRLVGIDVFVKLATIALVGLALLAPTLPQFQGKAFAGRAIAYPIALVLLPVAWSLFARQRLAFPVSSDILLGLPFLIDMAGNALNLYDTVDRWDDLNHLGNWALHTAAIVLIARTLGQPRPVQLLLGIAWAAVTAIMWELAEYVAFVPNSPEAATAYRDTLGDLALGLTGGTLAAAVVAFGLSRRHPVVPPIAEPLATGRVP